MHDGSVPGPYASLEVAKNAGAVTLNAGNFLNTIISFIIVAFAVFLLIKGMNTLQAKLEKKEKAAEPTTKECPYCCSQIPVCAIKCPNCTSDLKNQKKK